jgi:hypothetical protein
MRNDEPDAGPAQGWARGMQCNYHARADGPVSIRNCTLIEHPFWMSPYGRWYCMLDKVRGIVPLGNISLPRTPGRMLSLLPDLVKAGLRIRQTRQIPGARPPPPKSPGETRSSKGGILVRT